MDWLDAQCKSSYTQYFQMFIIIVTIIIIFIIIDISTANTAGQYKRLLTLIPHVFVTALLYYVITIINTLHTY